MKYKKPRLVFKCVNCIAFRDMEAPTVIFHEIFYGSLFRKKSIDYNLQAPLCQLCHDDLHNRHNLHSKDDWTLFLCVFLGIDKEKTLLSLNTRNYKYLEGIKEQCKQKILSYQL